MSSHKTQTPPLRHAPVDEGTSFIADAMLGSLARKMRILGFDVAYFREGPDSSMEALARKGSRVILTGDRGLAEHAGRRGLRALLISGASDGRRLAEVVSGCREGRIPLRAGPSRCAECNVGLRRLARSDARAVVAPGVLLRHRLFYTCPRCSKVFWKGSHWPRLRRMSASLAVTNNLSLRGAGRVE